MTDDWGIICSMQANANNAVAKEGAGRTRGTLGLVLYIGSVWHGLGVLAGVQWRSRIWTPREAGTESVRAASWWSLCRLLLRRCARRSVMNPPQNPRTPMQVLTGADRGAPVDILFQGEGWGGLRSPQGG